MFRQSLALAGSMLISAQIAQAGGTLYAVRESDDVLVKIDLDTLTFSDVGSLGTAFAFGGLAFDPGSQTMYMAPGRNNNSLYRVNLNTGAATLIGSHGVIDMFGLAFDTSTNTLYATQFSQGTNFYRVNTSSGAATLIGNMGRGIGGLAYDYRGDRLIGVQDGAGDLFDINRSTGATTLLYDGPYCNDSGLAYDPERNYLWGIDWNGVLYYFDVNSGFARTDVRTGLGAHDGLEWVGALGPSLSTSGDCPGRVTVSWNGATPSRPMGIVFANTTGNFVIPGGACGGTQLGLSNQGIQLVYSGNTGANGSGQVSSNAGTLACRKYLQMVIVDGSPCTTTNVAQIP
ncbi:MAG: hypothetical protein KJZ69_05420 [Phycisphaerales bacterium]|nr:hypothetical protein [Phycisphaerales bacterium]